MGWCQRALSILILLFIPVAQAATAEPKLSASLSNSSIQNLSSKTPLKKLLVPVGMYIEHLQNIKTALQKGECPSIYEYPFSGADDQVIAEFLVLCEALKRGGIDPEFSLEGRPVYTRLIHDLAEHRYAMLGFAAWGNDANPDDFWVSEPVLKAGEFVKGIYGLPSNAALMAVKDESELIHFSAVSNPNWILDKHAIDCLGSDLHTAQTYLNMFRVVAAKRGDYLLISFPQNESLVQDLYGVKLVPLRGVKVVFNEPLQFYISKRHPLGELLYTSLNKGLRSLEKDGGLHYVYNRLGFFNPKVKDWAPLRCKAEGSNSVSVPSAPR